MTVEHATKKRQMPSIAKTQQLGLNGAVISLTLPLQIARIVTV